MQRKGSLLKMDAELETIPLLETKAAHWDKAW